MKIPVFPAVFILMLIAVVPVLATDPPIKVSISCSAHGDISPKGDLTLAANANLSVTATPDVGYEIQDWYYNGLAAGWGDVHQRDFSFGNMDATIYVLFQRFTNIVHTSVGSSGQMTPGGDNGSVSVGWGDSVTFTATPIAHYHVDTWMLDNVLAQTGGTSFTIPNMKTEHVLAVNFAADIYTIQASASAHGTLTPTGAVAVVYGDSQFFSATADTGYDTIWSVDGRPVKTNVTTYTFTSVSTNHTLQVAFTTPTLSVVHTSTNSVILSWPSPSDGWQLEGNSTARTSGWANAGITTSIVNGRKQAVIVSPQTNHFYRLSK